LAKEGRLVVGGAACPGSRRGLPPGVTVFANATINKTTSYTCIAPRVQKHAPPRLCANATYRRTLGNIKRRSSNSQQYMKVVLIITSLLFSISCVNDYSFNHSTQDQDFALISEKISPNNEFVLIEYHFDIGALGYSRIFWAICPNEKQNKLNLKKYILPDGYKAIGWTEQNEAIVEKWEPYYYKSKNVTLTSGDIFKGVRIIVK